jgi:Cytidylate kinase-like family
MAVWTISAQAGTGGDDVAVRLAVAAGVPLLDRKTLALFAHALNPLVEDGDELEARVGGPLNLAALSMAMTTGSVDAFQELQLRQTLPELGRAVVADAARYPCVIFATAAFAALPEHPSAIHVRLRAPLEWRIASYQREHLVDRHCAEKALKRSDHLNHAWVKTLYRADVDDSRLFSIVVDASRSSPERVVEILLAAGGVHAAAQPTVAVSSTM